MHTHLRAHLQHHTHWDPHSCVHLALQTHTNTGAEAHEPRAHIHQHGPVHTGAHTHKHVAAHIQTPHVQVNTILVLLPLAPGFSSLPTMSPHRDLGARAAVTTSEAQPRTSGGTLGLEGQGEVAKEMQNLSCSTTHTASSQPASGGLAQEGANSSPMPHPPRDRW